VATTPTLRPLGVGEILDAGIRLYLRHWKPLMICVAGIVLPVEILSTLVMASIDSSSIDAGFGPRASGSPNQLSGGELAAFMAVGLSTLLATAACFKAIADASLGMTPEAGRSLRFGASRVPALIWLSIVAGVFLVLASFAFVIPAIWLFVSWSLAVPALLTERLGAVAALRRSFRLVRHRWWPTLGVLAVGYLLASIVAGVVQLIPSAIAGAVASHSVVADAIAAVVGGTVSAMISTPYIAAILTLLYFDQRVRKEGLDLQLLADGLDADAPVPAPPAGPERQWWRDPQPAIPGEESARYGGGFAPPSGEGGPERGNPLGRGAPADGEQPDPKRADWLPPEAPRGPGGL
jgi:hypothetical protein